MGPLPKKRHSPGRRNRRRAHDALAPQHLLRCQTCGAYHLAHHVCATCGSYNGREIVAVKADNS